MINELIKQQYAQMRGVDEVVKDTSKPVVWVTKETLTAKKAIEFIGYKFQSNCDNNVKIKPRKLKQCNKCGLYKCVDEFTRNAKNKDGLSDNCRACIKKYRIEHSFYKKCSKCAKRKPLDEFANNSSSVDGKSGYCIKCNKTYLREYHESKKKKQQMTQLTYSENGCIIVSKKYEIPGELKRNIDAIIKEAREQYGSRIIEMIVREDNMTFDVKLKKE